DRLSPLGRGLSRVAYALLNKTPRGPRTLPLGRRMVTRSSQKRSETLMRYRFVFALMLLLASVGFAAAQETTSGSITGEVTVAQGARGRGPTVTLTSDQGSKTFATDADGRFCAPYLTPAMHSAKAPPTG